jgi:hypothetical protein
LADLILQPRDFVAPFPKGEKRGPKIRGNA